MASMSIWVMTVNGERARLLQLDGRGERLEQIEVIDEAEAPVQETSAVRTPAPAGPTSDQPENQEDVVCIDSSPALANLVAAIDARLDRARREGRYGRLVVIAPHDILPHLLDNLSPEVRGTVMLEMDTDMTDSSVEAIRMNLPI